ncbi:hypothetical protein [Variovorax ginsengisoli]|uniref:Uncharacterized protein n=1 Tax=Variovorax ginsengisoli TaxID=363844 RepID=A0ABT9S9F5_9BURK|nr:hypothetical protein [Variovorax ginsengisoli]MDP9900830.1 hypothetical protein [Variovorax ginsengisoli]
MSRFDTSLVPAEHAVRVIGITTRAWRIAPESAHAIARRAPHGHVPFRSLRRIHHAACEALGKPQFLAHTW